VAPFWLSCGLVFALQIYAKIFEGLSFGSILSLVIYAKLLSGSVYGMLKISQQWIGYLSCD
jgi:hypothetical protein